MREKIEGGGCDTVVRLLGHSIHEQAFGGTFGLNLACLAFCIYFTIFGGVHLSLGCAC